MALPIIPIMLGLALFAFAGKKRTGSGNGTGNGNGGGGTDPDPGNGNGPGGRSPGGMSAGGNGGGGTDPGNGGGAPGSVGTSCQVGPNQHGVWNESGQCQVFWDEGVKTAVVQHATAIWEGMGSPDDICAPDEYVEVYDEWTENPRLREVSAAALSQAYGVAASVFPASADSPHWVQVAWNSGRSAVREALCGVLPGT